jgi:pantetheine-phosphate adenylyltransferase
MPRPRRLSSASAPGRRCAAGSRAGLLPFTGASAGMSDGVAIYPGTFDPVDARPRGSGAARFAPVRRGGGGGGRQPHQAPFFTLEERVDMAREVLAPYPNVRSRGLRRPADGFPAPPRRAHHPARPARGVRLRIRIPDGRHEPQPEPGRRDGVPDAGREIPVHFRDHGARDRRLGGDVGKFVQPLVLDRLQAREFQASEEARWL